MISFDVHGNTRHLQPLLVRSYVLSILVHFSIIASLELLHFYGLTEKGPVSMFLAPKMPDLTPPEEVRELEINLVEEPPEPTIFFDADPNLATEEKPEETPYYAVIDSMAGNPDTSRDLDQPEMEGTQDKVLKTSDTMPGEEALAEPVLSSLQPAVVQDSPQEIVETETDQSMDLDAPADVIPEDTLTEEPDASMAVDTNETETEQPAEILTRVEPRPMEQAPAPVAQPVPRARPKTLAEARKRNGMLVGESLKQEGGVKRFRIESSPDLLATPFGAYDAAVIQAIQQRWFDLLAEVPSARHASGKVVLKFYLRASGDISDMEVEEDTVGVIQSLLCQKAVKDPSPYGRWPSDMRRLVGADYRQIRFTFYYN